MYITENFQNTKFCRRSLATKNVFEITTEIQNNQKLIFLFYCKYPFTFLTCYSTGKLKKWFFFVLPRKNIIKLDFSYCIHKKNYKKIQKNLFPLNKLLAIIR